MKADPLDDLETLLDRISKVVRSGHLADLAELEQRLSTAIDCLQVADPGRLEIILAKASRNQGLMRAANRGIRSAKRRLDEIARALDGLTSYDRKGQPPASPVSQTRLNRRF